MENNNSSKVSFQLLIPIAIVLGSLIWGAFYYTAQTSPKSDVISVTGSAKTTVTSDQAKIILSISRVVPVSSLAGGNDIIARDLGLVRKLVASKGFQESDVVASPLFMDQMYDQDKNAETRYNLRQMVTLQSPDVAKITDVSKAIPTLASQGAIVSVQSLEYYYSKLPELRVTLLSSAIKDAMNRADSIVQSTGHKVGSIRSASSGVVQVLPVNSVEVSDYGSYDTSSVDKDVMVTVKATFGMK